MQMYPKPGVWENLSASETCSLNLKDNLQTLNKMSNDYGPIYHYLQGILNPSVKFFFIFLKGSNDPDFLRQLMEVAKQNIGS